ncbi:MAG: metallophosphoesterase, partial [Phaeodactylibacter sp.]|nr:metallophosphoesterase [Phaeodactylibacter sp.]
MKRQVDICVLSDVHLGHPACQADKLVQYMEGIAPNVLILNGDFIDRSRTHDPVLTQEAYAVFEQILHLAGRGTKIYYISGQQDQFFRKLANRPFLNIHLRNKLILQLQGKKHLFFHGDILSLPNWVHILLRHQGSKGFDRRIQLQLWGEWLQRWRPTMKHRQTTPDLFRERALQIA